jgi:hypothetical protein
VILGTVRAGRLGFLGIAAICALLLGAPAFAQDESACAAPQIPALPEAAASDEAALKEARDLTLGYIEEATRYRSCLDRAAGKVEEMIAKTEEGPYREGLLRRRAAILEAHDANADDQNALRDEFNGLVRAYKAAHS